MEEIKLLRGDDLKINEKLTLRHLTINEIIDFTEEHGEENYFSLVNLFIMRPYDLMDKLDDVGIDYESISEYDLFIMLYKTGEYDENLKLLSGCDFKVAIDNVAEKLVLYDEEKRVVIDEEAYIKIKQYMLKIHHINLKPQYKAGNETIKKFRIAQKRRQRKAQKNEPYKSQLFDLVSSIVIGSNGAITFSDVWDLPIYTAFTALMKTLKIQNYSHTMLGVYTGNISLKDVPKDTLDWTSSL